MVIEYVIIVSRTFFLYFLIIAVLRLMGKREIGELSVLDLVVFMMIAEMAAISIEDIEKPMLSTILPMLALVGIQIGLALISLRSKWFREIVDGKPSVLINKGNIDEFEMKKQRYNLDDLLTQLRDKNVKNVADVEFAILEPSGNLSVFEKDKDNNQNKMSIYPFPVIMDGKIQEKQLEEVGKNSFWLRKKLREKGYKDVNNIFLCTINSDETLFIQKRNNKEGSPK